MKKNAIMMIDITLVIYYYLDVFQENLRGFFNTLEQQKEIIVEM